MVKSKETVLILLRTLLFNSSLLFHCRVTILLVYCFGKSICSPCFNFYVKALKWKDIDNIFLTPIIIFVPTLLSNVHKGTDILCVLRFHSFRITSRFFSSVGIYFTIFPCCWTLLSDIPCNISVFLWLIWIKVESINGGYIWSCGFYWIGCA